MKLERRHGLFAISGMGIAFVVAVLAHGDVAAQNPANDPTFVTNAVRADWEGIDYPALDRLISERAALARAKDGVKVASR